MVTQDRQAAPAATWGGLLQAASTPQEILEVVRDFVATWTPQETSALPPKARLPLRFTEPEDVVHYAFDLSQARLGGEETESLLRMWRLFMDASQRIGSALSRAAAADAANASESR